METIPKTLSELSTFENDLAKSLGVSYGRVNADSSKFPKEIDWVPIIHPDLTELEKQNLYNEGKYFLNKALQNSNQFNWANMMNS